MRDQPPIPRQSPGAVAKREPSTLGRVTDARLTGLTNVEARRRLEAEPPHAPASTSRSYASIVRSNTLTLFNLILGSFWVVINAAGRPADGLFGLVLVANTGIGIMQDVRAKRALDRLALLVAPHARVVRDGREGVIPAAEVVDGDVVALRPGDQVVADGAVVESSSLELDESQLSGESHAVAKQVGDELLSGSFCVEGGGRYLVNRTGDRELRLAGGRGGARVPLPPLTARKPDQPAAAGDDRGDGAARAWRSSGCSSTTTCASGRQPRPPRRASSRWFPRASCC